MVGLNQGLVSNAGGAVRRRQGLRLRPRGRPRGHRRVPRDQVRRDGDVGDATRSGTSADWYEEAVAAGLPEPEAMALATATPDGAPSVRFVLLKGIDERGVAVLHQLREPQGPRAGGEPARRAGDATGSRCSARCGWRARSSGSPDGGVRRVLRHRARGAAGSAPGRRRRAADPVPRVARGARRRGRRRASRTDDVAAPAATGAATGCARTRSSSGRAARTACTTAALPARRRRDWTESRLAP